MKKLRVYLVSLSILGLSSLFLLVECGKDKGTGPDQTQAKWTILGYIDGNCYLDETPVGSFFITKVQDMEEVGSTDDVNIIVMVSSKKTGGVAKYYYVEKHLDEPVDTISSKELKDMGSVDMSDGNVLAEFINYVLGKKEYEAQHYMLILADHGGGWRGVCWDEIQDPQGGACITMPELRSALSSTGKKFDIIAFDACLMGMFEVAYEIREFANYMIASQNVTWATIDIGYKEWLTSLVANPDTDAKELAENIAKAIYNAGVAAAKEVVTASIDLSKVNHLGTTLNDLLTYLLVGTYGEGIQNARNMCYVEPNAPDFVDLKEFVSKVKQEPDVSQVPRIVTAAEALENAIVGAVPFKKGNVQYPRNGLSLYFPVSRQHYTAADSANYAKLSFSETAWHNFVAAFVQASGGPQTGTLVIDSNPQGAQVFLDGEDLDHQTPLTIENVPEGDHTVKLTLTGYLDWQKTVHVTAGQTTQVNATLTPVGTQQTRVSGRVTWPGHTLSANAIAFLDSSHTEDIYVLAPTSVDPTTGNYTITIDLQAPMEVWIEAWDNLDGDGYIDAGEGFGWYDPNGNGVWDDMITLSPGQQLSGINITLQTVTRKSASMKKY